MTNDERAASGDDFGDIPALEASRHVRSTFLRVLDQVGGEGAVHAAIGGDKGLQWFLEKLIKPIMVPEKGQEADRRSVADLLKELDDEEAVP